METKDVLFVAILAAICYYLYNLQKRVVDLETKTAILPTFKGLSSADFINYVDTYNENKTI